MQRATLVVLLLAVTWLVPAVGQTPTNTITVFEGARVIAGDGRAPIENTSFVVNGGRFAQIGKASEMRVPGGAARVQPGRQDGDAGHHRYTHAPQPNA